MKEDYRLLCKSGHYKATAGESWLRYSMIICQAQQEAANVMCVYMADLLQGGVLRIKTR